MPLLTVHGVFSPVRGESWKDTADNVAMYFSADFVESGNAGPHPLSVLVRLCLGHDAIPD